MPHNHDHKERMVFPLLTFCIFYGNERQRFKEAAMAIEAGKTENRPDRPGCAEKLSHIFYDIPGREYTEKLSGVDLLLLQTCSKNPQNHHNMGIYYYWKPSLTMCLNGPSLELLLCCFTEMTSAFVSLLAASD